MNYLEFEKPLAEIEGKAEELRAIGRSNPAMDVSKEAEALDRWMASDGAAAARARWPSGTAAASSSAPSTRASG